MPKPWENSSGLPDPTAYAGGRAISKEEQRVTDLVHCIRYIARMAGFEITNRWVSHLLWRIREPEYP